MNLNFNEKCWLKESIENLDDLNEWEQGFIENIEEESLNGKDFPMSEGRHEKLYQIYKKAALKP